MLPPISPEKEIKILINIAHIIWQVVQLEMEMSGGWDNISLSLTARINIKSGYLFSLCWASKTDENEDGFTKQWIAVISWLLLLHLVTQWLESHLQKHEIIPENKKTNCLIHEVKTKGYDASCVYIIPLKLKMSLTGPILLARTFQMDNICHLCSLPLVLYVSIVTSRQKGFCSARIWKLRIRHLCSILSLGARNLASAELLV